MKLGTANTFVRRIGTKICITFLETGAFVWIERDEEELLGGIEKKLPYEGQLPLALEQAIATTGVL